MTNNILCLTCTIHNVLILSFTCVIYNCIVINTHFWDMLRLTLLPIELLSQLKCILHHYILYTMYSKLLLNTAKLFNSQITAFETYLTNRQRKWPTDQLKDRSTDGLTLLSKNHQNIRLYNHFNFVLKLL